MALSLELEIKDQLGAREIDAYAKIYNVVASKDEATISVDFYTADKTHIFDKKYYQAPISGLDNNVIALGYVYLKTLPEFKNAIDC